MTAKTIVKELLPLIATVILLAFLPVACAEGLDRQARADYEQCLSWQADGHPIDCQRD